MKNIITLIIVTLATAFAVPQVKAQQAGDILVPQRTGTSTISLKPLTGATYAVIRTGSATLTSGSATVTDGSVTAASVFLFTGSGTTAAGSLTLGPVVAGANFKIISTSGSDARTVFWWMLKQ